LKQALELCSIYGVKDEQRVKDQEAAQRTAGVPPDYFSHAPVLGVGILDRKLEEKMSEEMTKTGSQTPKDFTMPSQDRFTQWRKDVATRQAELIRERFNTDASTLDIFKTLHLYLSHNWWKWGEDIPSRLASKLLYRDWRQIKSKSEYQQHLDWYLSITERAEKKLFADPTYAPLLDFAEKMNGIPFLIINGAHEDDAHTPKPPRFPLTLVTAQMLEGLMWWSEEKVEYWIQENYHQPLASRVVFATEIWQSSFGIGSELLKLLRAVCNQEVTLAPEGEVKDGEMPWLQGLQFTNTEALPLVKYAPFLPETFVADVMKPFVAEVLIPTLQAS
jgi:hypothetical protein